MHPIPFQLPRFYPILDTATLAQCECSVIAAAEALVEAGVRILQYRHKDPWTQADFAYLLGAALHVGQDDLPPVAARRVIGENVMGFSTHNRLQLTRANEEPVDYLALGPIFSTRSKLRPDPEIGLERLRELRPLTPKPVVAIGGIRQENARQVLAAGADSVAVIAALWDTQASPKEIRQKAEEWLALLA